MMKFKNFWKDSDANGSRDANNSNFGQCMLDTCTSGTHDYVLNSLGISEVNPIMDGTLQTVCPTKNSNTQNISKNSARASSSSSKPLHSFPTT